MAANGPASEWPLGIHFAVSAGVPDQTTAAAGPVLQHTAESTRLSRVLLLCKPAADGTDFRIPAVLAGPANTFHGVTCRHSVQTAPVHRLWGCHDEHVVTLALPGNSCQLVGKRQQQQQPRQTEWTGSEGRHGDSSGNYAWSDGGRIDGDRYRARRRARQRITMECRELPSRRSTNDRFAEAARRLQCTVRCLGNAFARRARHQTKNVNTGTDRLPGAMLRHRRVTAAVAATAAGQAKSLASRSASASTAAVSE